MIKMTLTNELLRSLIEIEQGKCDIIIVLIIVTRSSTWKIIIGL